MCSSTEIKCSIISQFQFTLTEMFTIFVHKFTFRHPIDFKIDNKKYPESDSIDIYQIITIIE